MSDAVYRDRVQAGESSRSVSRIFRGAMNHRRGSFRHSSCGGVPSTVALGGALALTPRFGKLSDPTGPQKSKPPVRGRRAG